MINNVENENDTCGELKYSNEISHYLFVQYVKKSGDLAWKQEDK